ncbi:MAG: G-D-S-L family lipolytic protein [Bacteroidota bacterium]
MKKYISYIAIASLLFASCEPEFDNAIEDNEVYTAGEADFSNFVSVGNSLTAGYADNALYREGQKNSFPNILAQQFELVGGGEFKQPLMEDNIGGLLENGTPIPGFGTRLVIGVNAQGEQAPRNISGTPQTDIANTLTGPFNNMGVPGAKSFHLLAPNYGDINSDDRNPYFVRFASSPSARVIEDAVAQSPSFFSLWIGNNDILGFATSGGTGVNQQGNLNPETYGSDDITDINVFASSYNQLLEALTAQTNQGVVFNLPNVTNVPFFTTVPVNPVPLNANLATILNANFADFNEQILPGLVQQGVITSEEAQQRMINFQEGNNYVTIHDESLTDLTQILQGAPFNLDEATANRLGLIRQATEEDLIILPASNFIGTTPEGGGSTDINGVTIPLGDQWVLTPDEQAQVNMAQNAYNSVIESLASDYGLAFVDVDLLLEEVNTGISFNGGVVTSEFGSGGGFSLDGVHLTPRGYALVANRAIEQINATYGSTLPTVELGDYRGVQPSNQ